MNYSIMTERETEIELSTSVSEGLTSFTAHDRLLDQGRNIPEKTYAKSRVSVLFSQIKNLYTLAFLIMGIITAACDFKGSFGAWIIFFAVAVCNMVSGFLRDNKERMLAVNFDEKRSSEVKIIRDGVETSVDPTLLVRGDIVVLEEGDIVPADLRILQCEGLKADETIFDNGPAPVDKQSEKIDDYDFLKCSNMLYTGSRIVAGKAFGAVVATGKDTVLAKINRRKSSKVDMHNKYARSAKSEKVLVCAAIIVALFVMVFSSIQTGDFALSLLRACAFALCLMPAPIGIVRMLAVKLGQKELESKGVGINTKDYVFDMGMTEYLLFDKGGMLTNNDVTLEEKVISDDKKLEMAVICSDCEFVGNRLTGNELDKATASFLIESGVDVKEVLKENEKILFMPFDEARKLMATLIRTENGYRLIVKGSIEVIPTLCVELSDGETSVEMSGEILHRLENVSSSMAEKGLKIRAIAYRDIDYIPENIEDEIKSLVFVGALGYRELPEKNIKEAVRKLRNVFVKPVMVTGDLGITASVIAKHAGLIDDESECISFRELGECSEEELVDAVNKYSVFSAATMEDREKLMRALSQNGAVTAVAGEQMADENVALYSNTLFGDKNVKNSDVELENCDINAVSDVMYSSKAMRGNMAYASYLAISVGLSEILIMLYGLFANWVLPSALELLVTNLFVMFLPCMAIILFGSVHYDVKNQMQIALNCVLHAFIASLFAIATNDNMILFVVLYAIFESARICLSFGNYKKGKKAIGALLFAVLCVIFVAVAANGVAVLATESFVKVCVFALFAVIINAIISHVKVKGLNVKHV